MALNGIYFDQIASGTKLFEFRKRTPYWTKRIVGRHYTGLIITYGYPKAGDPERTMRFPYLGYEEREITHEHFGDKPVSVFAIRVGHAWRMEAGVPVCIS